MSHKDYVQQRMQCLSRSMGGSRCVGRWMGRGSWVRRAQLPLRGPLSGPLLRPTVPPYSLRNKPMVEAQSKELTQCLQGSFQGSVVPHSLQGSSMVQAQAKPTVPPHSLPNKSMVAANRQNMEPRRLERVEIYG